MNTLEFIETDRRRELRARFTDPTVASLSGALTAFFAGRVAAPFLRRTAESPTTETEQPMLPLPGEVIEVALGGVVGDAAPTQTHAAAQDGGRSDAQRLAEIFPEDGGKLRLDHPLLKATGKLDYAQRLTCLFLYAQALRGHQELPRIDLNEILDDVQVYDGNFRSWLSNNSEVRQSGENVRLLFPGRQRAQAILQEMFDPEAHDKWVPGMKGPARRSRSGAADGQAAEGTMVTRPQRGRSASRTKQADDWVVAWKQLGLNVDGHAAMRGQKNWERGLLGLWAIRRVTRDEVKEVSRVNLTAFLWAAFEIKINDRSLGAALESEAAKGKVEKVGGTKYQALPPGMTYMEELLGLASGSNTAPPAKGKN